MITDQQAKLLVKLVKRQQLIKISAAKARMSETVLVNGTCPIQTLLSVVGQKWLQMVGEPLEVQSKSIWWGGPHLPRSRHILGPAVAR